MEIPMLHGRAAYILICPWKYQCCMEEQRIFSSVHGSTNAAWKSSVYSHLYMEIPMLYGRAAFIVIRLVTCSMEDQRIFSSVHGNINAAWKINVYSLCLVTSMLHGRAAYILNCPWKH
jgi:hypothetical protein